MPAQDDKKIPSITTGGTAAAATESASDILAKLKNRLKRVEIDGETFYLAEGDMLLDEKDLQIYARQREALEKEQALKKERASLGLGDIGGQERTALLGTTQDGKMVRWKDGMILTYCILKNSFTIGDTEANYKLVKDNFKLATWAWEGICGIKFQHKEELDTSATLQPDEVTFTVREYNTGGNFIALAFFPTDPKNRRRVFVDPSYYDPNLPFDRVGVFRHELGHVLGFRHEHIRSGAPPVCPHEDLANTIEFGAYDPQSVMHYFCGGIGSKELAFTDLDKAGAQKLYGLPLDQYVFVE
ncbi:MAG: hypothetical protein WBP93_21990 [Pyrinomonadaceae bacterium]